jgi:hypothetical protein
MQSLLDKRLLNIAAEGLRTVIEQAVDEGNYEKARACSRLLEVNRRKYFAS